MAWRKDSLQRSFFRSRCEKGHTQMSLCLQGTLTLNLWGSLSSLRRSLAVGDLTRRDGVLRCLSILVPAFQGRARMWTSTLPKRTIVHTHSHQPSLFRTQFPHHDNIRHLHMGHLFFFLSPGKLVSSGFQWISFACSSWNTMKFWSFFFSFIAVVLLVKSSCPSLALGFQV